MRLNATSQDMIPNYVKESAKQFYNKKVTAQVKPGRVVSIYNDDPRKKAKEYFVVFGLQPNTNGDITHYALIDKNGKSFLTHVTKVHFEPLMNIDCVFSKYKESEDHIFCYNCFTYVLPNIEKKFLLSEREQKCPTCHKTLIAAKLKQ